MNIKMDRNNYANGEEIPLGFGMALAQNQKAMNYFSSLSNIERQSVINNTHNIKSKKEMQRYVEQLVEQNQTFF